MTSEATEAMIERAHEAYSTFGQVGHLRAQRLSDAHMKVILTAALAARPAPEAGSVVERLRKGAIEIVNDGTPSQAGPYPEELQEAADIIEAQAAQIASLSAKIAEVERERDEARKAHDADAKAFLSAYNRATAAEARASELQREVERKDAALVWYENNVAGCRLIHSGGHAHRAALDEDGGSRARAALQQEGESDV